MNIRPTTTSGFVVCMARARYRAWREMVELFKVTEGAQAILGHVPDADWFQHFAANEDAFTAVVVELTKVAD